MTEWDILLRTLSHRNRVYRRRVEENILHSTFTQCYVYIRPIVSLHEVFLYDIYAIKMDIRPRPVSIFDGYGAIKENIYVMLRKQARKWQHQTSRQSLHSWEFCTRLWSCFSDSLKIVFFQMQQVFIIESQSELFKLFLQLGNNAKLLILCFLTSWAVAVTSVQGNAFSRKKDAVWKFQCVVLFFVKFLF